MNKEKSHFWALETLISNCFASHENYSVDMLSLHLCYHRGSTNWWKTVNWSSHYFTQHFSFSWPLAPFMRNILTMLIENSMGLAKNIRVRSTEPILINLVLLGLSKFSHKIGTTRFWWGCHFHCDCHCDRGKTKSTHSLLDLARTGIWQLSFSSLTFMEEAPSSKND